MSDLLGGYTNIILAGGIVLVGVVTYNRLSKLQEQVDALTKRVEELEKSNKLPEGTPSLLFFMTEMRTKMEKALQQSKDANERVSRLSNPNSRQSKNYKRSAEDDKYDAADLLTAMGDEDDE